jgi:ribosome biogenesis GTPase
LNHLESIGWSDAFASAMPQEPTGLEPARVALEHRSEYRVWTRRGEVAAGLTGRLRHEAITPEDRPAVGDWVAIIALPGEDRAVIHAVLPRRSALLRKAAGRTTAAQVVAANLDTVFLVTSMNRDLNPRRIERTLAVVWESGSNPVVLLTKSDLADDPERRREEAERVAVGVPVIGLSSVTGEGLDDLDPFLEPGATVGLIGSSGVGKSTLVNRLAGEEILAVKAIREDDDRGRHTTSHRQLVRLPSGALVVDTPGMREIGLLDAEEGVADTFPEIVALAEDCRFRDCTHATEPGCAVRAALEDGSLPADRHASWEKLRREEAFQTRRTSIRARLEEQRKWKRITMSMRKRDRHEGRMGLE